MFCSTKAQTSTGKSEAEPILGVKDTHFDVLLTPSPAGLKCLPALSLYEVDESLEKQDYIS